MDKQKQQLIITAALGLVLVVVAVVNLKPKKKRPAPVISQEASATSVVVPEAVTPAAQGTVSASPKDLEDQAKRAQLDWGLDPFYHAVKTEIYQSSSFVLKGVSLGKDKGYVFVNDQILTIGDTIAGYKVVEVQKNKVLLSKGNEKFYLVLPEEE